jgi:hypothetical protein
MNPTIHKFLFSFIFLIHAGIGRTQISTNENIKYIRSVFKQINSEKNLKQLKLENEELSDEVFDGGISLIGFFRNKKILKIEQWAGLSYGTSQIDYYFDKDSLVFVYVIEKHFRQTGDTIDHSKTDTKFEGRYYYKNDKLIHISAKGSGLWSQSDDAVKSLLPDSKDFFRLLNSKRNNDG